MLLLFVPKFNIVDLQAGGAAGLRIDDILLLSCFMLFAAAFLYWPSLHSRKVELAFVGWVAALLTSNVLNVAIHGRSSFLYSLRFLEYFLFFYFGYYFAQRHELRTLAKAVLWINAPIMVLQKFGLLGGFASAGYVPSVDRAIGLTGGPWEIGVLINFCLIVFLFSGEVTTKTAVRTFLVTTSLLLLTASRMAMISQFAILAAFYRHKGRNIVSVIWKSAITAAILACGVYFIPNPLQERSLNLFSSNNIYYLQAVYERTPDNPTLEGFGEFEVVGDSDLSWLMRVSKWCVAVKVWTRDPTTLLFGVGPGTLGIALDGGWLRVLVETGVVGMIMFLSLARCIWRISLTLRMMLVAIAVNMLMIDIYLSYKVIAFLLFTTGYYIFQNENTARHTIYGKRLDMVLPVKL